MTINQSGHNPNLVFHCKIKRYSVHCGQVRMPQHDGALFHNNNYFIAFDEIDMLTDEPVDFVRLYFKTEDSGWLGSLDHGDGHMSIRVMLPDSEFTKYYNLLRDEKDVYFICAFEQKLDGSTGEMRWFDLANINVSKTTSQVEENRGVSKSDDIKVANDEEVLRNLEKALDAQHHTLYERITLLATGNVTTTFNHALQWPNPTTLAAVDRCIDLLQFFLADAQRLKEGGRPAAHDRLTAVLNDLIAGRATLRITAETLATPDPLLAKDRATWVKEQNEWEAKQMAWIKERNAKAQEQAKEVGKLL